MKSIKRPISPSLIRDIVRYLWLDIVLYVVYLVVLATLLVMYVI